MATQDEGIKEISLYKGKCIIKFYGPTEDKPNRHIYYKDGKRLKGVTTYLGIIDKSVALGKWYQEITVDFLLKAIKEKKKFNIDLAIESAVQNDILKQQAADLGTQAHEWCERYINNKIGIKGAESPDMPEEPMVLQAVTGFLDWEKENKPKFIESEKVVYSKKSGYVGTLDIEAMIDKKRMLIDLKTSNGLYNSVRLQTAAYAYADTENTGKNYAGRWALRLSKLTEKQHNEKEARKKEIKKFIAKYRSWKPKEYPSKPYVAFEDKYLDAEPNFMERDYKVFLLTMALTRWNNDTSPFYAGENW